MSASITAPRGLQTLNPSPEISRYYNKVDAPYINTAQVLSEVLLPVRYPGQTFLVVDEEWWFKSGKLDADLVLKQDSGTGITDLDYTPSPTQGTVTSSTGTDAIISLADNTNAGLMSPSDKETLYDNVIYRSGTEVGKPVYGDIEIGDTNGISTEEIDGMRSRMFCDGGKWYISILGVDTNLEFQFNPDKGIFSNKLFDIDNDEKAYIQKGHIVQLEEDVFNLELNKLDASAYNDRFKGVFATETALVLAYPIADAGDYAQVNEAGSATVVNYNWDAEDEIWVVGGSGGSGALNTDALPEGASNFYFTTARVLATVLSGISLVTGGAIVSTDSVLVAFGKIQKQLNDFGTALGLKQDTLNEDNFGTFTNSVADKNTQSDTDTLAYVDITTGKLVKQTFSKLVDYLKGFFQTSRIIVTSNITAVNGSVYHNNGNNTFTDPTPENNRGYYVLNISGSPTIGGNTYSVGTYLFRYYDGTNWINNTIKKGVSNAVYSANKTLTPMDNNDTIFMDSGTLTVNPTAQAYQNGYTIAVASSGGSNTPLVLQSATDWSYVINANASILSGSVFIEKGGTATIVRKANLKIFQINGSVI